MSKGIIEEIWAMCKDFLLNKDSLCDTFLITMSSPKPKPPEMNAGEQPDVPEANEALGRSLSVEILKEAIEGLPNLEVGEDGQIVSQEIDRDGRVNRTTWGGEQYEEIIASEAQLAKEIGDATGKAVGKFMEDGNEHSRNFKERTFISEAGSDHLRILTQNPKIEKLFLSSGMSLSPAQLKGIPEKVGALMVSTMADRYTRSIESNCSNLAEREFTPEKEGVEQAFVENVKELKEEKITLGQDLSLFEGDKTDLKRRLGSKAENSYPTRRHKKK